MEPGLQYLTATAVVGLQRRHRQTLVTRQQDAVPAEVVREGGGRGAQVRLVGAAEEEGRVVGQEVAGRAGQKQVTFTVVIMA